jgi:hypothetical protein
MVCIMIERATLKPNIRRNIKRVALAGVFAFASSACAPGVNKAESGFKLINLMNLPVPLKGLYGEADDAFTQACSPGFENFKMIFILNKVTKTLVEATLAGPHDEDVQLGITTSAIPPKTNMKQLLNADARLADPQDFTAHAITDAQYQSEPSDPSLYTPASLCATYLLQPGAYQGKNGPDIIIGGRPWYDQ